MQAIVTKYLPPTNFKVARIKAVCATGSLIVDYHEGTSPGAEEQRHHEVAEALAAKLGWCEHYGTLHSGWMPDGNWCHVFAS